MSSQVGAELGAEIQALPAELVFAAKCGWRVLPCHAKTKKPLISQWPERASNDVSRIRSWFKTHRGCNWAAATGEESAIFALDIDGDPGAESIALWVQEGNVLPPTLAVNTGRGKHLYFSWPQGMSIRTSVGELGLGLDIRGRGACVIIPPSIHPTGTYYSYENDSAPIAAAPTWLLEKLANLDHSRPRVNSDPCVLIPEGQRHSGLMSIAGSARSKGMGYEAILQVLTSENERCSPALSIKELKSIAKSAAGYSVRSSTKMIPKRQPDIVRLAEIQAAPVNWLWNPYLPIGMLAMLSGDPSAGKTYVSLALSAALTTGRVPCCDEVIEPADVLYLTAENSPEHVLRPRFDSLSGDPKRLHLLRGAVVEGQYDNLRFSTVNLSDVDLLGKSLARTGARLVVVDPIQSYFGASIDLHRSNETRPVLDGLARLASEHSCCILLVRHLTKATGSRAVCRGLGSIDLTGAARSELLVGSNPENQSERGLIHIKSNVGQLGPSIGFIIGDEGFRWTGNSPLTTSDILAPEATSATLNALSEASEFLTAGLAYGARPASEIYEEAIAAGISHRTLRRAKERLGVKSRKSGMDQPWEWTFPEGGQR